MAIHAGFISNPLAPIWCANEALVGKGWVLMQEDIFLYLFIYVFLFQRAVNPQLN